MKLEHVAFMMADPIAAAEWYVRNLGMEVVRGTREPPCTHFIADEARTVMFEIYCNPAAKVPDYAAQHPLVFHLAFKCEDVAKKRDELVAAGATLVTDVDPSSADELVMLRDPWGVPLQLVKRVEGMI